MDYFCENTIVNQAADDAYIVIALVKAGITSNQIFYIEIIFSFKRTRSTIDFPK